MKLREFSKISPGYLTRSAVEPDPAGSHYLLQIRDFDDERRTIDPNRIVRFTPSSPGKTNLLLNDDVVFLAKGSKNFAAVVADLPSPSLAASYFFIIRPNPGIQPAFLAWFLNGDSARQYFARFATTGAHMPVIRRDILENLEVPVADIETQTRIVALDALAKLQAKLLHDLAAQKQRIATAACRKALTTKTLPKD